MCVFGHKLCVLFLLLSLVFISGCSKSDTDRLSETIKEDSTVQSTIENPQNVQNQFESNSAEPKKVIQIDGIYKDANSVEPIPVGQVPAIFTVKTADGNSVTINSSELTRPVVLTFFRGGWCPYCNRHLADMRTAEASLKKMGFDVWFMSTDKPELLYESLQEPDIGYTLYSDAELEATKAFGIGFTVDAATHEKYLGYGINLSDASGFDHQVLPAPSTFILGTDGKVHFQDTNPDYTVRLSPEDLLAAAKSYVDKL